ncbi:MAG: type II secretion system protein GspF [Candidatus Schekmanbacteria bacterium RIFCSPHIGHO2_02_FULL_38_11]|uniref:Type II secretion system protein GspF n=1 Tax=Candidatus Schekmanbacteria bacterium RIFCSPLOWO2_12_FULL_38_15 TaxID=1817883 RepID=A0A1F7SJ00_9BACT|nr:MAG: type II secretion system protein GspF [Candidatus Schekmanbacteria bacterium GWA2_38_9]OGL47900.1 MAG: type II secretion system protein GspF [Candidatus Schekmanbacteria bacterium RIFCSPLOWO2_02_FULL_38_14]OGL53752.1 MAG: type II secretion system protein GspF [Candidatus Schekmanbacteria bacterium RIFCSPLOWO2_12_FULL_38_15]OGL55506.1 MAG: type II secretion system protein GspF [Candidatus Schekmanbacteria bacterium RIFCSPHIGHO2_02_FULL_38_11]
MGVYEYNALNFKGKEITGIINADSLLDARQKIRGLELHVSRVRELEEGEGSEKKSLDLSSIKGLVSWIKPQEISLFSRQLATLLKAGLPLIMALNALIDQFEGSKIRKVIYQIREKVNEGSSLANALSDHPRYFSDLYVSMVRAGEASGALDIVLERLAEFSEKQNELKNKIRATLAYPVIMCVIGFAILGFLFTYVIPKVTSIFEQTKQALPLPTLLLIGISSFLKKFWLVIVVAIIVAYVMIKRTLKTEKGRYFYDNLKLKLPIFGSLFQKIAISRFARTLGTLLNSGIPILQSLDIVKTVVANKVLHKAIEDAGQNISEGADIATPLKKSKMFPPIVIHMVATGERSGQLENMLLKVAESYDSETDSTIKALTSLMEPIMIVLMGIAVGFVVIAILLPIFDMTKGIR